MAGGDIAGKDMAGGDMAANDMAGGAMNWGDTWACIIIRACAIMSSLTPLAFLKPVCGVSAMGTANGTFQLASAITASLPRPSGTDCPTMPGLKFIICLAEAIMSPTFDMGSSLLFSFAPQSDKPWICFPAFEVVIHDLNHCSLANV